MAINFDPVLNGYSGVQPFRFWCQKVLPLVYDDSLSYYELLNKVVDYINNLISDVSTTEGNVELLHQAYQKLQGYVNDYFDNLDVQEEINNKLDEMARYGELNNIINPYLPDIITAWLNDHVTPVGSAVVVDDSLSVSGAAADARITGDGVNYGMKKHLRTSDMTQGFWAGRNITTETRRICVQELIDVEDGDVLYFSDNDDGLYWSFGIYEGTNTTASGVQAWTTAQSAFYILQYTGKLYVQFATAGTAGQSQPITPSDLTLEAGVLTYLGKKVYELSELKEEADNGTEIQILPKNVMQGYWVQRNVSVTPLRLCVGALIPVKKGDVLKIENNASLYYSFGIYVGNNITASGGVGWTAGNGEHVLMYDGLLYVQYANASTAASSTTIVPSDLTLVTKIIKKAISENDYQAKKMTEEYPVKTIAFLGDSITAGVGTNFVFHQYLANRFGWNCKNYGYGGSGFVRNYPSTGGKMSIGEEGMGYPITETNKIEQNNFLSRIESIDTNVDGLVIFGGTNDWAHGGSISIEQFANAVNGVLDYAQTNFGNIPIIIMSPLHRLNDDVPNATTGKVLADYVNVMREACKNHGVYFIDLFSNSGLNPANAHNQELYFTRDDTAALDNIHPNHYGHIKIANLIAYIVNSLMY